MYFAGIILVCKLRAEYKFMSAGCTYIAIGYSPYFVLEKALHQWRITYSLRSIISVVVSF
jgi:hypothetical protein